MKERVYSGIPVLRQFVGARSGSRRAASSPATTEQEKAFAFLADAGEVCLPGGGLFPLAGGLYSDGGFAWEPGWAIIGRAGRYLAVFTVSGEADAACLPEIGLTLSGGRAAGESARLLAGEGGAVQGVGSAVIEAAAGERVGLRAGGPLRINGTPAATLTLIREV